jgi:hypothetical protein
MSQDVLSIFYATVAPKKDNLAIVYLVKVHLVNIVFFNSRWF